MTHTHSAHRHIPGLNKMALSLWLCLVVCGFMPTAHASNAPVRPGKQPPRATPPTTPRKSPPKTPPKRKAPKRTKAPARRTTNGTRKHPLQEGIDLCRRARWRKARDFFTKAKRTKLLQLPRKDRPMLYLYLGLSQIHLLQQKEGMRSIENALLLDECTQLPTNLDLSPQIKKQFQKFSKPYRKLCTRRRLAALRKRLTPPRRRVKPTAKQRAKLAQSRGIRLAAWLVLGSGAVAFGSACVAGGLSVLAELRRNEQQFTSEGTIEYVRQHKLAEQRALVANVLFGTAGALLFTGFALQLSQLIKPPPPPRQPPPAKRTMGGLL